MKEAVSTPAVESLARLYPVHEVSLAEPIPASLAEQIGRLMGLYGAEEATGGPAIESA